ncbi:uncharacterized protein N7529_011205 [Penicillium soppii]|uniref:uncharacterized protein n=1 Tax=Penicillium soppii TaxID=69789 RepID=UPI002549572D|nr:uncharacterized protein N7529_011205 [Penicillium soppii]KAJ5851820.1 hypothetical protein N7529_011205 [Penicillium soppii]
MIFNGELSFYELLLFVEDLKSHCERNFDMVYLPQESPIKGRCPAIGCNKEIIRSTYIHDYIRREIALDLQVSKSKLEFCYGTKILPPKTA